MHYVEPYFGGGSVLFENDPSGLSEVVSDLSKELSNFWSVLQDDAAFADFHRCIQAMPFSEVEFDQSTAVGQEFPFTGSAVNFFVRCRQSLAGRAKDFTSISRNRTRRGMNEQVSAWLTTVEGLPEVHARLKRVLILNRNALDVIRQQDGEKTFFYLDPPYIHSTRKTTSEYGEFEMTNEQHAELLLLLASIKGKFLLSGYRCDMYDNFAEDNGWSRVDFSVPNHASGAKEKRRMIESVWLNY